jgi:hypothetical protein
MGLGTNHITSTTAAVFLPELWSKELQIATESNLVAARLVKRFDQEVKKYGAKLDIPAISNLVANTKSASTQVSFQTFTETKIQLLMNTHKEASFIVEDYVDAQTAYRIAEEYKHKGVYALAKQIDTDILALYTNITQTVGTAAVDPSDNNFLRAIQYLDDADAPDTERFFIMAPKVKAAFLQIDKYVNQDYTGLGDIPVKTGLFGQRYGIPFYVSTNVPLSAGNPVNLLAQKEVYCAAIQKDIELRTDYIIEYVAQAYVCQVLYGVLTYRAAFGVQVLS